MKVQSIGRFGIHVRVISALIQIFDTIGCEAIVVKDNTVTPLISMSAVMSLNIQQHECFEILPSKGNWTREQKDYLIKALAHLQIEIIDEEVTRC